MTDPTFGIRQHVSEAGYTVERMSFDEAEAPADDNALVAEDAAYVCARCDRRITAGQPMRRRATGGWAHEAC
jgi:hypothetical protein